MAEQSAASYRAAGDTDVAFGAETLLARLDARAGRADAARRRLAALGPGAERRPSVPLRLQFLAARAGLALAEARPLDARRDLAGAVELARVTGRKLDELELRLLLAEVQRQEGDPAGARATAGAVAEEADQRGLGGLVARARRLAGKRP